MVIYGVKCVLIKRGGHNLYGDKVEGARIQERCGVVKLATGQGSTTVRVDSGATRGGAEEGNAHAVLLMRPTSKVEIDDLIEIHGVKLRVTGKRLRFSVYGRLDHFQVEANLEQ